jgi:ribosomal protein S13
MSSDLQEIEQAIRTLPRGQIEQIRDWIENFLEDQFELTDEFKTSIERGKADIAARNTRVREGARVRFHYFQISATCTRAN